MELRFKKALVTGGSSGIGQALAQALLAQNIATSIVSRKQEGVPPQATWVGADLASPEGIEIIERLVREENFDLVINAAGSGECQNFADITPADAARAWTLMVEAPRRISAAALPALTQHHGALVNISSIAANFPLPYMTLYNSAKAAVSAVTLSLSDEFPTLQIIDLRPGDIKTNFGAGWKIPSDKKWTATARHMQKMMEEAPAPAVVVRTLFRALKNGHKGTLRAGDFLQTFLMPLGARLAPESVVDAIRRAYLMR